MNLNIYSIHDLVAKTYTNPFYMHNDGEAKRMFLNWTKNPDLPMAANPDDYSLYHIGFYDTDTGNIEGLTVPNLIIKGSSLERQELKAVVDNHNG